MSHSPIFVGRRPELDRWNQVLADPAGQAVLVVGHPGMGKTFLVDQMAHMAREHPTHTGGAVRYEVTPSDDAATTMAMIMDHAFAAADVTEKSFDATPRRLEQWRTFLNVFKIGDLAMSLRRDPQRNTRDQFIDRLELISDRMHEEARAVFVIDPEKEMQRDSDQDWAIVIRQLPAKIKIVFAQRPDDVLVSGEVFQALMASGRAVQIPHDNRGVLDEQAIEDLIQLRASEMKRDPIELRQAVERYERHPYAVPAALDLIAAGTPIDDLPPDPTPTGIAGTQWSKIGRGGANGALGDKALALFHAYAILEVPVPDDVVEIVAGVHPTERQAIMTDTYIGPLLRTEGEERRIYHAILADHIRDSVSKQQAEPYHRRAIDEFRKRLHHAKQAHTAPDTLAARRLAPHVRKVDGPAAFARTVLDECGRLLWTLGLLDAVAAVRMPVWQSVTV